MNHPLTYMCLLLVLCAPFMHMNARHKALKECAVFNQEQGYPVVGCFN